MTKRSTPVEVLIEYGKAWFERDDAKRLEVLRESCTEDVVFVDQRVGRVVGLEAVSKMIGDNMNAMSGNADTTGSLEESRPTGQSGSGVKVDVVTPIEELDGFFRYSFVWTMPDGTTGSGGTDFCEVAEDGRMKLITVWSGSDHFPVPSPRR